MKKEKLCVSKSTLKSYSLSIIKFSWVDCYIVDVRHHGYYVFISESEVDVDDLSFLTPVYHEKNRYPPEQSIIQFPDGIQGHQLYIYMNKSNPVTSDLEYNNNVLDICEVEIWGN